MDTGQVITQSAKRVSYIDELDIHVTSYIIHALTFILSHTTVVLGCAKLKDLEYGTVKLTGTHVGAKATYTCDYGYELVGHDVRKCQYNGYWSGEEPRCHGK